MRSEMPALAVENERRMGTPDYTAALGQQILAFADRTEARGEFGVDNVYQVRRPHGPIDVELTASDSNFQCGAERN